MALLLPNSVMFPSVNVNLTNIVIVTFVLLLSRWSHLVVNDAGKGHFCIQFVLYQIDFNLLTYCLGKCPVTGFCHVWSIFPTRYNRSKYWSWSPLCSRWRVNASGTSIKIHIYNRNQSFHWREPLFTTNKIRNIFTYQFLMEQLFPLACVKNFWRESKTVQRKEAPELLIIWQLS